VSATVIKERAALPRVALQEVVLVVGAKGSGKSTLIKALFPELAVEPGEARPYRLYELGGGLHVAEVCGSPDALGALLLSKPAWKLLAALVLVDGAAEPRVDGRALALASGAPARALVLTKADAAPPERVEEAKALAARVGFEFFAVSAAKGIGVGELRRWLAGALPAAPAARALPAQRFRFDVIPVPAPGALEAGGLGGEELEVLKLCDGRRSAGEIARALGLPYGRVRGILDELRMRGYLQALLVGVVGG
jgi:energy-coupling factor transporter ATP-binding protein EcfA2